MLLTGCRSKPLHWIVFSGEHAMEFPHLWPLDAASPHFSADGEWFAVGMTALNFTPRAGEKVELSYLHEMASDRVWVSIQAWRKSDEPIWLEPAWDDNYEITAGQGRRRTELAIRTQKGA